MKSAIILFAHGARDPEWAQPFIQIRERVAQQFPSTQVMLAFLELMQPTLVEAVAKLTHNDVEHITLIPLFLARGGHLKQDLPRLIASIEQHHPTVKFNVAPAIGEEPEILDSIARWVVAQHRLPNKKPANQ